MKAYKLEILIIDFDEVGPQDIKVMIEDGRYPNRCISPDVRSIQEADIGEWDDDHPLNKNDTRNGAYEKLDWKTIETL